MQVSVTFRQMDPTPALKDHAEDRVQKIAKYVANLESSDASVVLSIEKYMHKADITINSRGLLIRGSEKSDDMYASIDLVLDKLERQIQAQKGANVARKHGAMSAGEFAQEVERESQRGTRS